ncbi:helix-turn-helix domain-containing protein [Halorussus salilacus]|uniref:helix-turn-helix domain-containing protein n=1 Tax=Halorussus salilacus TaxID=2953750 RepID=UPI0020A08404|nr:helix-turn-helix domain-containing protein [Halorussus salilacus]USZ68612.1 helix-turn-helix domain-containing protein [Halorussus salilacus]
MDTETTFDILNDPVRRNVIAILHDSGPITRAQLAAELSEAMDDAAGPETARGAGPRQLRISLHHNHLPRLADAGVVEYDGDGVAATSALDRLAGALAPSDIEASSALV